MRAGPVLVLLAILSVTILAQPSRPTDALQIGDPSAGFDVRFPVTVSQCEPVLIYFNVIGLGEGYIGFDAPDEGPYNFLIRMQLPRYSFGYMKWICNIPAGYRFLVYNTLQYYVNVQAGPSSCLGNITTRLCQGVGITSLDFSHTPRIPQILPRHSSGISPRGLLSPSFLLSRSSPTASSIVSFPTEPYSTVILKCEQLF